MNLSLRAASAVAEAAASVAARGLGNAASRSSRGCAPAERALIRRGSALRVGRDFLVFRLSSVFFSLVQTREFKW